MKYACALPFLNLTMKSNNYKTRDSSCKKQKYKHPSFMCQRLPWTRNYLECALHTARKNSHEHIMMGNDTHVKSQKMRKWDEVLLPTGNVKFWNLKPCHNRKNEEIVRRSCTKLETIDNNNKSQGLATYSEAQERKTLVEGKTRKNHQNGPLSQNFVAKIYWRFSMACE